MMFKLLIACALTIVTQTTSTEAAALPKIRFNEQIRSLLSDYCFTCHGPDSSSRKAELRLDTREGALASGAIVPGSASDSELISRITSDDPEFMMPPPNARKKLEPAHKQLLARWIDAGAEWEEHWAFTKPRKTELPQPTDVQQWACNPIDHFVFEKLRELGLKPSGQADRHTLVRRAALDLIGLPPTREMVEAFLADTKENAYARYIDALLASKHAGEHRARYWLDAARYGDTHGMHVDNYREIWLYRDWVIRAFNSNMPFDQFVIEQIAGDLLPEATLDQRIATGFNRCNITTAEGGAIPEELNVRYMVDRVETTATVFLGLTAGCAVCHDHKYDPITQREFYQLGAFFNNTTQPANDGNQKDTPPVVTLPDKKYQDEWVALQTRRKELRTEMSQWKSSVGKWWPSHQTTTKHPIASDGLLLWLPLAEGEVAEVAKIQNNGIMPDLSPIQPPIKLPDSAKWATEHPLGRRGVRFGEGGELSVDLPRLPTNEPLTISFWFRTPDRVTDTTLFDQTTKMKVERTKDEKADDEKKKNEKTVGWQLTCGTEGEMIFKLFDTTGTKIMAVLAGGKMLHPRAWQHVCVRYSGGQSNASVSILVNGRTRRLRNGNALINSESRIGAMELTAVPLKIASRLPTAGLSDVRIFRRWVSDEEARLLGQDSILKKLLALDTAWNDLDPRDRDRLAQFYNHVMDKDYQTLSRELSRIEKRRDFIYSRSTTTLVMQERPTAPRAWVLERGEYDKRRDEVTPSVPAMLPSLPKGAPNNRLGLAQWLVHRDHPLTARVMVNRIWQSVFGVGLVKTSEDFGVMGDRPSQLALLDWLAVEFVESGWNVNHMLKLIVTSATYRQSSVIAPKMLRKDPANRFLSRGPRLRLDAEVLRDQALAVSGLLRRDVGGPSVRPYQPSGLWKVVALTNSNTREFKQESGDALYRRSLYTFWKRTSPPPSMAAFNAPTREQCTVRRERTNTPLQALVLMNDPQFVEAARHLATNAIKQQNDDRKHASWMLTSVLCRPATEVEVTGIASAAAEFRAIFEENRDVANELINIGDSTPDATLDAAELAAWTMVANTLMNRDDFINK